MITLYDKNGKPVYLGPEEAAKAVASGTLGFAGERARVVSPEGKVGTVPVAQATKALAKGFRLATDAEGYKEDARSKYEAESSPLDAVREGVKGAVSSASFGLSDLLARPQNPYGYDALAQEEHQTARKVGEVAGLVGSLAIGAGAPAMAEAAGKAVGAKVVGDVAAKTVLGAAERAAVTGVTEGTLYGLGAYISEEGLSKDPQLDAEKLLATVGAGAFTGGVLSGGVSLAGSALKKGTSMLASKLGGKGLQARLDEFANEVAIRQHANKSDLAKQGLNAEERQIVGDYGLKKGLFAYGDDAASTASKAGALKKEIWDTKLGKVLGEADKAGQFDTARFTARLQQELIDPIAGDPALESQRKILEKFIKGYQDYGPGGTRGPMSFSKAWELRSNVTKLTGFGEEHAGAREALAKMKDLFRDEIVSQADAAVPNMSGLLRSSAREYRNAAAIHRIATDHIERLAGNRYVSPSDMLAGIGGAALGGPMGAATAAGAAAVNHAGRVYGGSIIARAAKDLASSGIIDSIANGLSKAVNAGLQSSPVWGGTFRGILETAAARGAHELLAAHVDLTRRNPEYRAQMGVTPETGDEANGYAQKAQRLQAVQAALAAHDAAIDRGIARFFGKQSGTAPTFPTTDRDTYREKLASLHALATDPQAMAAGLVPADVANLAPGLAATMAATGARAIQFLAGVAPKPPRKDPMKALDDQLWEPSPAALSRWARYVDAVEQPGKVLHDLREGYVTQEQVDALRAVYPKLLQDIQTKMIERLAQWDKPLEYGQRMALSRLFGSPVGGAGDPQRRALIAQVRQATLAQNGPTGGGSDGRQKVDAGKNLQTQAQRIEGRGA